MTTVLEPQTPATRWRVTLAEYKDDYHRLVASATDDDPIEVYDGQDLAFTITSHTIWLPSAVAKFKEAGWDVR